MAAFNRPTNATYETHENVTIDTQDNEDHTFCGIMFPIKCKDLLPVDHLVVKSVAVRGHLGPLTVWVSKTDANYDGDRNGRNCTKSTGNGLARRAHDREGGDRSSSDHKIPLDPSSWTKLYDKKHKRCPRGQYTELVFDEPFILIPGEMRALYIHSTLASDQAIVYDNSYYGSSDKRYEDDKLSILTGRAHVSTTCFGQDPIWGWGNAWRERREFVGRLEYGTVFKLWNPEVQPKFGSNFQQGSRALFLCQRRWESPVSKLPDEAIFYILNMCRWDWFDDTNTTMKDRRKREKARNKLLSIKQQEQEQQEIKSATSVAGCPMNEDEKEDAKPAAKDMASDRCTRSCNQSSVSAGAANDGKPMGLNDNEEGDEEWVDMSDDDNDNDLEGDEDDEDITIDSEDAGFNGDESSDEDEYHTASRRYFSFQNPDTDDDEEETEQAPNSSVRGDWFRHQYARIHVLRALASMEDQAITQF